MIGREQQTESVMAFAARERNTASEKPTYRHCGKYGHTKAGCYKIIWYPTGWGTRGRGHGQ